jgi:predicted ATPase/DNA-binding SARP family transcriptional activator
VTATETTTASTADAHLRVELLDGVTVRLGGRLLDLGARRPRALIARLALEPGVRVPLARLAEELWREPPPSADVTLRSVVSRLRAGSLEHHLQGGRGGYALEVDPMHVDVVALRRAARDAVPSELRSLLERWESAWTGRPLDGLGDAPFARREAESLAEEHAAAIEDLAGMRLDAGEVDLVMASLGELAMRRPLGGRSVSLLATALARAGREDEALRVIDELAARLEEAEGLDLPAAVLTLRTSILRRDPGIVGGGMQAERLGVPLPITELVGRGTDLAAVLDARARSRLVTITGAGGVGKTRIAIEALRRGGAGDRRQVFLDLVPFRDLPTTLSALAELVGAIRPDLDAISGVLRGVPTVLVLDNAEHLRADVAALVRGLLDRCDGLGVLVTSRDPLRIPGERRVRIEPMLGEGLDDAVRLFAARATDIDAGFRLDATTEPLVRSLVVALDGIPLALELAAARLPSRSLSELATEIRARGIIGGASDPGRHASVTSMVEWSTALLSPAQQELLGQLSGFAGAFSHDAAVAVCEVPGADVDELLLELVERSLVSTARGSDGATVYRLLIAVREVVRRRYAGDRVGWRERHRRWHAELVDRLRPALYSAEESRATLVLERTAHDVSAALADSAAARDRESALLIVGGMARVWYRRSALVDGVARIEQALAIPGAAPAIVEARAQLGLCLMHFFMREPQAAGRAVAAAIAAAREADAASILAVALAYRGYLEGATGDAQAAIASVGAALAVPGTSVAAAATVQMIAADLQRAGGAPATALAGLERAIALAREAGEQWVQTLATHLVAKVLIAARRGQEAIDLLAPVIRSTWREGRPTHTIAGLFLVAAAAGSLEENETGARLLAATDAHARRYSWDPDANDPDGNREHRMRLRAALTDARWEAAVAAGEAMALADAVTLCSELATPRRGPRA